MQKHSLKKVLLSTTLLAITGAPMALVAAAPAGAQEAPAKTDVIVVTGTRIVREGYVSASPVMTVDAGELEKQNPTDVEQVLRAMPQFAPGNGEQVNNGSSGTSTVDLRGLTTPRTLPLIDGKRMVGFDPNGLFDISAIPVALLKRIDVVTGGASAVYGSDAVAGVVNFILNDDFQGVQADANYSITDHGDGETDGYQATMGASIDGGRGNVALSLGYTNREAVYQSRFPASATPGNSSTTVPTAVDSAVGARTQITGTGGLVPFYQGFNFNPQNLYQSPSTKWNATALGHYDITDHVQAYSRFIYSNSTTAPQIASTGTFGFSFNVPLNNPFLTAQARTYLAANNPVTTCSTAALGQCVNVGLRWRALAVGPRQYLFNYDTFQELVGLKGDFDLLGSNWKWDVAGAHGESSLKRQQNNDISSGAIQQALFATSATTCSDPSNFCAPLNIFNPSLPTSAASLDFIRLNLQVQSRTTQDYVTGSISGDLGKFKSPLAKNPIGISFGSEYRDESSNYAPDAASASGLSPGFGQTLPIRGRYDVTEEFIEGLVPVIEDRPFIKAINLELGYRNSNYSTSGVTHSYKYGADYSPIDGLRFRGMFQRAVRAANISELFSPRTPTTGDLLVDPCANGTTARPLAAQLAALCVATGVPAGAISGHTLAQPTSGQINSFTGGNQSVTPEIADTKTFGAVWQPSFIQNLAFTVDYYDIKVANAISIRPNYDILDGCYNLTRNTTASATNIDCKLIRRNTTNGTMEGDLIYGVEQITRNIGQVHAEGVDYSIQYKYDLPGAWGGLNFNLDGTHVLDASYVPSPGGATVSCEGHYGKQCGLPSTVTGSTGGPTPKDHFVQRTSWDFMAFNEGFEVSYLWRHLSGSTVDPTQAGATGAPSNKIPAYDYLDLFGSWQVTDWAKLKIGVTNVTGKKAPEVDTETGSTASNSGNTYPSTYDVLGRIFQVGVTTKF